MTAARYHRRGGGGIYNNIAQFDEKSQHKGWCTHSEFSRLFSWLAPFSFFLSFFNIELFIICWCDG